MADIDSTELPKKKRSKKHDHSVDEVHAEVPASGQDTEQNDEQHAELLKEQQMYRDIVNKIGAAEQQKSASAKQTSPNAKKAKVEQPSHNETSKRVESRRSYTVSSRLLDEFKRISKPQPTDDGESPADTAFRFIDPGRNASLDSQALNDQNGPSSMDWSTQDVEAESKRRKDEPELQYRAPRSRDEAVTDASTKTKTALTLLCTFAHVPVSETERDFAIDLRFATEFEREWKARRALVGRLVKHRHRLAVSRARQRQTHGQKQNQQTQARAHEPKST